MSKRLEATGQPELFWEAFAGSAAVSRCLVGALLDLVPWLGGKRRVAPLLLRVLGLRPRQGARSLLLSDPGPWGWVWPVLLNPATRAQVVAILRAWAAACPACCGGADGCSWCGATGRALNASELWGWLASRPPAVDLAARTAGALWRSTGLSAWHGTLDEAATVAAFLVLQAGNGRGRPVELTDGAWRTAGFAHLTESAREKGFTERLQLPILGDRVDQIGRGDWPAEVACAVAGAEQVAPLALNAADGLVAFFDPPYHQDGERERSRTGYGWDLAHERVLQLAARTADARAKVLITEGGPLAKRLGPGWHSANITAHFTGRVVGEEWITTNFPIELGSTRGRQHSLFG